jgi:hypothetical protein
MSRRETKSDTWLIAGADLRQVSALNFSALREEFDQPILQDTLRFSVVLSDESQAMDLDLTRLAVRGFIGALHRPSPLLYKGLSKFRAIILVN